mmetsp:Transcript_1065/g.2320  ORF Transcript_1065/g.2320 Transcript_1065/m.2320 type:complete len:119 (-) Transcript_1065:29-385(-)
MAGEGMPMLIIAGEFIPMGIMAGLLMGIIAGDCIGIMAGDRMGIMAGLRTKLDCMGICMGIRIGIMAGLDGMERLEVGMYCGNWLLNMPSSNGSPLFMGRPAGCQLEAIWGGKAPWLP